MFYPKTHYVRVSENNVLPVEIHGVGEDKGLSLEDTHIQEIIQMLREILVNYVPVKRKEESSKQQTKSGILTGSSVRIGYTFKKRPGSQQCLVQASTLAGPPQEDDVGLGSLQVLQEKVLVYAHRLQPGSPAAMSQLVKRLHNKRQSTGSGVSISSYFQRAPSQASSGTSQAGTSSQTSTGNQSGSTWTGKHCEGSAASAPPSGGRKSKIKSILKRVDEKVSRRKHKKHSKKNDSKAGSGSAKASVFDVTTDSSSDEEPYSRSCRPGSHRSKPSNTGNVRQPETEPGNEKQSAIQSNSISAQSQSVKTSNDSDRKDSFETDRTMKLEAEPCQTISASDVGLEDCKSSAKSLKGESSGETQQEDIKVETDVELLDTTDSAHGVLNLQPIRKGRVTIIAGMRVSEVSMLGVPLGSNEAARADIHVPDDDSLTGVKKEEADCDVVKGEYRKEDDLTDVGLNLHKVSLPADGREADSVKIQTDHKVHESNDSYSISSDSEADDSILPTASFCTRSNNSGDTLDKTDTSSEFKDEPNPQIETECSDSPKFLAKTSGSCRDRLVSNLVSEFEAAVSDIKDSCDSDDVDLTKEKKRYKFKRKLPTFSDSDSSNDPQTKRIVKDVPKTKRKKQESSDSDLNDKPESKQQSPSHSDSNSSTNIGPKSKSVEPESLDHEAGARTKWKRKLPTFSDSDSDDMLPMKKLPKPSNKKKTQKFLEPEETNTSKSGKWSFPRHLLSGKETKKQTKLSFFMGKGKDKENQENMPVEDPVESDVVDLSSDLSAGLMEELSLTPFIKQERDASLKKEINRLNSVADLNDEHLRYLVRENEHHLRQIFEGRVPCQRHELYKQGGRSKRELNYECRLGHYNDEQVDIVMECLMALFCKRHHKVREIQQLDKIGKQYLDYVMKVLLPEMLIKLHMDVHGTSHSDSEGILAQ